MDLIGGFYSNAYDYEKLLRALYLKTILLPETISEMEKDRINVTIGYSPLFRFSAEWHYGMFIYY
jgi:CubicO group peptidase (beta-lactamase class C family)